MEPKRSRWLAPQLRKQLWKLRQEGLTLGEIGKRIDIAFAVVWRQVTAAGGIPPRSCPRRGSLTDAEREEIVRGLAREESFRCIAARVGRPASTISREVGRNGGRRRYSAHLAVRRGWQRARRPKPCKLVRSAALRRRVETKLICNWSPQQIARWLRATFPNNPQMQVSHETIYRTLYVQARGALKKELLAHLRSGRSYRRPRARQAVTTQSIVNGVSISQRPPEANDRAVPGHWEGDLLFGGVNTYIATLVERKTRFCLLAKVTSKDTHEVMGAIRKQITRLPTELRKSITWDRGSEASSHAAFTVATGIPIYFCDPHSPWQRGTNENTNGLLRQYFPHGSDLSKFSQADLNRVARELNDRPRMTLDWLSPALVLRDLLR